MAEKVKYVLIAICILAISRLSQAQSTPIRYFTKEFSLVVDNDYPFMTDEYYSAGQAISYRFISHTKIPLFYKNDSSKNIFMINYGTKVFTPRDVDTEDISFMDRPYCGWNFIEAGITSFRESNTASSFLIQAGVVGPASGMGNLQQWVHQTIHLYGIHGWDSQIVNEFILNVNYNHTHAFPLQKGITLISSTGAWIGTGSNRLSQEFTFMFFRFNSLNESSYMNAVISDRVSGKKNELFLFVSAETDIVLSNIFIQGSLFDNPSPYTTSINSLLFMPKIGMQYSGKRLSGTLSWTHMTMETSHVLAFDYATAAISYRF